MVDKQLHSYATQSEVAQAVGRVEKVVYELRADLHKAMNDQLRWVIGTQIAVTGLAIAAFKLL